MAVRLVKLGALQQVQWPTDTTKPFQTLIGKKLKSCEKYTSQKGRTVGMAGSGNHSTCDSTVKAARPIYWKTWNFPN